MSRVKNAYYRTVIVRVAGFVCPGMLLLAALVLPVQAGVLKQQKVSLDKGLTLLRFEVYNTFTKSPAGISVLRIDPAYYGFRLVNASATKSRRVRTAREWAGKYKLIAAINASMYQHDYLKSVAYMKTKQHTNNAKLTADKIVMAFDPVDPTTERRSVRLIDRQCDDFARLRKRYHTLIQNIRMFSCRGKNVWSKQKKYWSIAAVGIDAQGHILFIHSRAPFSVHDFINQLAALPIGLARAMYVEGGPEAQLYVRHADREYEFFGSYETGFNENHKNNEAWPVPNVIGIYRRTK